MTPENRGGTGANVQSHPRQMERVLWIIAILLAIIATALITRPMGQFGPATALADTPMAGARGIFAFTGQLDKNRYGLFMMDVDNGTVWCYEYLPATRKLKLVAARSFRYDRYLEDYSCDEPTLMQVNEMLRKQRRIEDRIEGGDVADDEAALSTTDPGLSIAADAEEPGAKEAPNAGEE